MANLETRLVNRRERVRIKAIARVIQQLNDKCFITPTNCWEWTGSNNGNGKDKRGMAFINGKSIQVHALSAAIFLGHSKNSRENILHICDNPICFNPDHLIIGTQKENVLDSFDKGRRIKRQGELNGRSKLKEQDVKKIIELRKSGLTYSVIAKDFNITISTAHRICTRGGWGQDKGVLNGKT